MTALISIEQAGSQNPSVFNQKTNCLDLSAKYAKPCQSERKILSTSKFSQI